MINIAEIGNLLLYVVFLCNVIFAISLYRKSLVVNSEDIGISLIAWLNFISAIAVFGVLIYCYIISDFSVKGVFFNSEKALPMIYKISASWSNHEGSMILWILIMVIFGFVFYIKNKNSAHEIYVCYSLIIQSLLTCFFAGFTIITSNPFERIFPRAIDGQGLNPVLQDVALSIHPPILYAGYVGLSLIFSTALSPLFMKRKFYLTDDYFRIMKPWIILSWSLLTIGVTLGSWWAYRELGWGGYWFWDPVENVSLIPWICVTALIHAIMMSKFILSLRIWAHILALMSFILTVLGTFTVRAGLISSVHSFTSDPERGFIILSFLISLICVVFIMFSVRRPYASHSNTSTYSNRMIGGSKEFFLFSGVVIFIIYLILVTLGTFYPLFAELFLGQKISINQSFFNFITSYCVAIIGVLSIISLSAKRMKCIFSVTHYVVPLISTFVICYNLHIVKMIYVINIFVAMWMIYDISLRYKNIAKSSLICHMGFALLIISIVINSSQKYEVEDSMRLHDTIKVRNYNLSFHNLELKKRDNYVSRIATFSVSKNGDKMQDIHSEIRFYKASNQQTTEAAIYSNMFFDIYLITGAVIDNDKIEVKVSYNPMISWIWLAGFMIAIGGMYRGIKLLLYN